MVNRKQNRLLLMTLIAISCGVASAGAARAQDAVKAPEITSNMWEDGNVQCAAVSLNGKDVVTFHGPINGHSAEQRAEDLANKLQDVLEDDKFDASKLVPAKEGELAAVRVGGSTVLKFEGDSDKATPALEQSYKLVNSIRSAYGADTLPSTVLTVADASAVVKPAKGSFAHWFSGPASWYGPHFHGRKCSDGSRFDMNKLTAAHRFLPFGTRLLVTNRKTGASCVVKVNDRGPFVGNRVIDLSKGAAKQLNMLGCGVAMVDCIVLGQ
jgi:hypothetical protein